MIAGPEGGAVMETLAGHVTAGGSLTRVTGGGDALGPVGLEHSSQNITVSTAVTSQITRARIPLNYAGSASGGLLSDLDGLETGVTPVHHEHAEALFHARFDVVGRGGVAARHIELLAGRQHLLNRRFPGR